VPTIVLTTEIAAPIEICFDLARSIDLHMVSTPGTGELAIAGRMSGLIGPGEEVTWEATHFGIRQRLTSRITAYDRPHHFRDSMVRGAFRRFDHDHSFEPRGELTLMTDRFDYLSPLGILGNLADYLFLKRYLRQLLETRAAHIKVAAETRP
jgi:ligand-binding SRPBCC domain-containing protein